MDMDNREGIDCGCGTGVSGGRREQPRKMLGNCNLTIIKTKLNDWFYLKNICLVTNTKPMISTMDSWVT